MSKTTNLDFNAMRRPFIIAEVSQNHDGSLGQAHAFIDAVAEAGADAVKFQTHFAEEESSPDELFRVNFSYCDKTRYDYWKRMEFTEEQWRGLAEHASESNLVFLSSPFSIKALNLLDRIGVPAWKFGSGEVFNNILIDAAIETGKPIILSTGLSAVRDIDAQVGRIRASGNTLSLLQCTTAYPTSPSEIGLNRIVEMRERYKCPVGLSDHSSSIFPSLSAITLGAQIIEVHVTFDKNMFGPDVKASLTMSELKTVVEGSQYITAMMSAPLARESISEEAKEMKNLFSKSVYSKRHIRKGEKLTEENICLKKPGTGIPVAEYGNVVGKTALYDIAKNQRIAWKEIV